MARLAWGESSSAGNPVLDVYIKDANGAAIDPTALDYAIFDFTTGIEVQVFPVSGYQAITIADVPTGQRLATGRFFASYSVTSGANVGTYRIRWRATDANAVQHVWTEEFEVVSVAVAGVVTSGISAPALAVLALDIHANQTATRVRRTHTYSQGVPTASNSNTTIACSVQPAPGSDVRKLPEADRSTRVLKFITRTPLRAADNAGNASDLITYDGEDYEVRHVEGWPPGATAAAFHKALAVRVEAT